MAVNPMQRTALAYVRNTNGGAMLHHFLDDHDPVGAELWHDLRQAGYVCEDAAGVIRLTAAGAHALAQAEEPTTPARREAGH